MEKIEIHDTALAKKAADNFDVSLTTVYRYINELCTDGLIEKNGRKYVLKETSNAKVYYTSTQLEEDKIFGEIIEPVVKKLPDNVFRIWQYAFTEMML